MDHLSIKLSRSLLFTQNTLSARLCREPRRRTPMNSFLRIRWNNLLLVSSFRRPRRPLRRSAGSGEPSLDVAPVHDVQDTRPTANSLTNSRDGGCEAPLLVRLLVLRRAALFPQAAQATETRVAAACRRGSPRPGHQVVERPPACRTEAAPS